MVYAIMHNTIIPGLSNVSYSLNGALDTFVYVEAFHHHHI